LRAPDRQGSCAATSGCGSLAAVHEVLRAPGRPLDSATRAAVEPRLDRSFGDVRVHTDERAGESARSVNALAYTVGSDIVFAPGQFAPETSQGRRLLVHELAHVVQQSGGSATPSTELRIGAADSPLEREAEHLAGQPTAAPGAPALSAAGDTLQRACGPDAIGSPTGCSGVGGDASGERFLFKHACDEFRQFPDIVGDQEVLLTAYARTLKPGDLIGLHGFASMEGDAAFNQNLSCARAIAAMRVISRAAPQTRFQLFAHGSQPGDADERRSVVVDRNPAAPEPTPEVPLPPPANYICGPKINDALAGVLADVGPVFKGWTPTQRQEACNRITSLDLFKAVVAWDIRELAGEDATSWLRMSPYRPHCGKPPAPSGGNVEDAATCSNSVEVSGRCFLAGTVNYALVGKICRLCNDEFGTFSEDKVIALVGAYKALTGDAPGPPTQWAVAGYRGFPGNVPTVGNRAHCTGWCTVPHKTPLPFTFVWEPHQKR
jgi:hypothetical protein